MKSYLYGAIAIVVIMGLSTALHMTYSAGKRSVLTQLKDDRITVLQDGKRIDESVLSADDASLFCMLTDCESD